MIKKQIIIDLQFGSEWQEKIHMENINAFLKVSSEYVNRREGGYPTMMHKDNKMEYKINDIGKVTPIEYIWGKSYLNPIKEQKEEMALNNRIMTSLLRKGWKYVEDAENNINEIMGNYVRGIGIKTQKKIKEDLELFRNKAY